MEMDENAKETISRIPYNRVEFDIKQYNVKTM
jgi:hypothetical protein